ncbi:hypothetical protein QBC46DRAFT_345116 [Diplogelasinospora grovesii]|uniref:Uncharacterized protein n=1 Tax=Diplogelasinospora grovesii TaxID=303347 RepID=A0AAN6N0I5_9PEZI|nr:hypothetical protein QBC46DRAFT_345116 [Diplogelasinospora grovesii]
MSWTQTENLLNIYGQQPNPDLQIMAIQSCQTRNSAGDDEGGGADYLDLDPNGDPNRELSASVNSSNDRDRDNKEMTERVLGPWAISDRRDDYRISNNDVRPGRKGPVMTTRINKAAAAAAASSRAREPAWLHNTVAMRNPHRRVADTDPQWAPRHQQILDLDSPFPLLPGNLSLQPP